ITNSVTNPPDNGRPTFASVPIVAPAGADTNTSRPPTEDIDSAGPTTGADANAAMPPKAPDAEPRRIARSSSVRRSSTSDPTAIVTTASPSSSAVTVTADTGIAVVVSMSVSGTSITSCGTGTGDGSNTANVADLSSASASNPSAMDCAVPRSVMWPMSSVPQRDPDPRVNLPRAHRTTNASKSGRGMSHSKSVTFTESGSARPAVEYPATSSNVDATPAVPFTNGRSVRPSASTTTSMNCSHNCDTTSHGESDPSRYTIGPVAGNVAPESSVVSVPVTVQPSNRSLPIITWRI